MYFYCNHRCDKMDMTLLLRPQAWTDGHDFVIATIGVEGWTTLLLQPQVWTDGHDFVIATTSGDRKT